MSSKDYIISELEKFVKNFQQTRARYEISNDQVTHIVEIVPNEVYHTDDSYLEWEDIFFKNFISRFPYENICFITDDSSLTIVNPVFATEGLSYAPISTHKESEFEIKTPNVVIASTIFKPVICFDFSTLKMPETKKEALPNNHEYALAA